MDPVHVVDGVSPERPSHQEICPCLRTLLRHSRADPRHVLHPIVLLNLQAPNQNSLHLVLGRIAKSI